MTEIAEVVHILDNDTNPILPSEIIINQHHCMARKADKTQCSNKKKIGDYCGMHHDKSNILRIDQPIPDKKKRIYNKKPKIVLTGNTQINNRLDETLDVAKRHLKGIISIQSAFRGWLIRKANSLRGPGFYNRSLCNNTEDIYLFEDITSIHSNDLMTIKDNDGFIYGFHIESIYKYIDSNKDKSELTNPYNKNIIPKQTISNIRNLYRYCQIIGIKNKIQNNLPTDPRFILRNKVVGVFQKMDELNNYTDIEWFMNLTNLELIKLVYLIKDLFDYRMELTNLKKKKILKSGLVFIKDKSHYKHLTFEKLRLEIIDEFDRLVSEGETRDDRYLGSLIILSGFVELAPNCAIAYPWLIQGTFN